MFSFCFIIFILSHIALVSIIFWLLSILGKQYVTADLNDDKCKLFECGFDSTSADTSSNSTQFIAVAVFLLLYDVELLMLLPLYFGLAESVLLSPSVVLVTVGLITASCVVDSYTNAISFKR